MIIKSNTAGKLSKMINGAVFSSEVVFVKELLQNAQRAKANRVNIVTTDNSITFSDDGRGCKNPSNLFTLDLSEWESTDEGFGIGFWSCLAVQGLISIKVRSYNWVAEIFIKDLLNNNLKVNITDGLEVIKGFEVTLLLDELSSNQEYSIEEEVINVGQYLEFDTFYNGDIVRKIDIFSTVNGIYTKVIENRFFKAKLALCSDRYNDNLKLKLFYDRREVCTLYDIKYVYGVVEPKPGKIDLREPDRTHYIWNDKYLDFIRRINKEIKMMYVEFLKFNPSKDELNDYADAIDYHLDVRDYEKYLYFDDLIDALQDKPKENTTKKVANNNYIPYTQDLDNHRGESIEYLDEDNNVFKDAIVNDIDRESSLSNDISSNGNLATNNNYVQESFLDSSEYIQEEAATTNEDTDVSIEEIKDSFSMDNYIVENNHSAVSTGVSSIRRTNKNTCEDDSKLFKKELRSKNKIVWVLSEDVGYYRDEMSKAEYVGLKVIVLDNVLYANVFKKQNKMHISEFSRSFDETFKFKNICLRNAKEVRAIENLIPICKKYNIPLNTFVIGDIEISRTLTYNGKVLYRNSSKNKKDDIKVYAVEDNGLIILDRTALDLSRFKLSKEGPFGINDLKYLFASCNTIAHELAHFLYGTQDNTVEHYQIENKIQDEIIKLYI